MLGDYAMRPADRRSSRPVRFWKPKEKRTRRLGRVPPSGVNFRRLLRAVGQFNRHASTDRSRITRRPLQRHAKGSATRDSFVSKCESRAVVARDDKIRPSIAIEVNLNERLRIPRHEEIAVRDRHGREMSATIAA